MDKETPIEPDKEILDIFKELKEKAKALNPNLLSDIKSFMLSLKKSLML